MRFQVEYVVDGLAGTVIAEDIAASTVVAEQAFVVYVGDLAPTVVDPPPTAPEITTTSLPNGRVGVAYSHAVSGTGGSGPYAWSIASGALPDGLTINATTGVISGTPTVDDDFTFTVLLTVGAESDTQALSIHVAPAPVAGSVPYSGPIIGTGATFPFDQPGLAFWSTPTNSIQKMVELGFDWFAIGGLGEVLGIGSRWDDHHWVATWTDLPRNDQGGVVGSPTGIQAAGVNGQGVPLLAQFYLPGGYALNQPFQWHDDSFWTTYCNRVKNTATFLSTSTAPSDTPYNGIYLDDESDNSFELSYCMGTLGLTELQARQFVFERGQQVAQAIVDGWDDGNVGHGPWITCYAMAKILGSIHEQVQIDVNGAAVGWCDNTLNREFYAGMSQVDDIFVWNMSADYYRHAQGNWHDGVHSGALDGSQEACEYAMRVDVANWRNNIVNYDDPSDPYNDFRVFGHPENFGMAAYGWWDGNQSPESFPHPNQDPSSAQVEAEAIALYTEGCFGVFFYGGSSGGSHIWDPDLDLRQYTGAIRALNRVP